MNLRLFTPKVQLYLGCFMPTGRYFALKSAYGTYDELLCLLGLFPHLEDFKLTHDRYRCNKSKLSDVVPAPQSKPLLRGRLTLAWFLGEAFLRDLSELCGGLRFYYMDLIDVEGSRFLLDTCAETLETLRVHPIHWKSTGKPGWCFVGPRLSDLPTYRNSRFHMAGH